MDLKIIEKLRLKFSPDEVVYLFEGINQEVSAGTEGSVIHQEKDGIYVYFKILGNTSTRFFRWDELQSGKLRTKEEWQTLSKSSWHDNQFTSVILDLRDIKTSRSVVRYVYGFANSDMIDEFVSILNRRHWLPVWNQDKSPGVVVALAKFKPSTDAELNVSSRYDISDLLIEFRRVIEKLRQHQVQGMRPDLDQTELNRCAQELGDFMKRNRELLG